VNRINVQLQLLRQVSIVSFIAAAVGVPVGCFMLIISFVRPELALERLYAAWKLAAWVGFGGLLCSLLTLVTIEALISPFATCRGRFREEMRRHKYRWYMQTAGGILVLFTLLVAAGVLPGSRYVHPTYGKWVSAGFGGSWEVSASVAATYLWRNIGLCSLFVLAAAFNLGLESRSLRRSMKSVHDPIRTRPADDT
jgi:hypothetical protein